MARGNYTNHKVVPPEERFWTKVDKTETCWLWAAGKEGGGYGQLWVNGRYRLAHRFAYELLIGPIPEGLTIDHLCRNRVCVNPAHLETVTIRENVLRGTGLTARNAEVTHCPQGHPYDVVNTSVLLKGGRACRACGRERWQAGVVRRRTLLTSS